MLYTFKDHVLAPVTRATPGRLMIDMVIYLFGIEEENRGVE
jgi:hypothetical protein